MTFLHLKSATKSIKMGSNIHEQPHFNRLGNSTSHQKYFQQTFNVIEIKSSELSSYKCFKIVIITLGDTTIGIFQMFHPLTHPFSHLSHAMSVLGTFGV